MCPDKETRSKRPESRFGMRGVFANSSFLPRLLAILYEHDNGNYSVHISVSCAICNDFM